MKKLTLAALAAGLAFSVSSASALTVQQTLDLYAYENGGVGQITQMQSDRSFRDRAPAIAPRAQLRAATPDLDKNDPLHN